MQPVQQMLLFLYNHEENIMKLESPLLSLVSIRIPVYPESSKYECNDVIPTDILCFE